MGFQRARTDEQIKKRIQEIVNAACNIFDSEGYDGLSFSKISEETNFTRPNIYKYFRTKDEILLMIVKDDFESYINSISNSFKINKLYSIREIAGVLTDNLIEHKRLLDLYILLSLIEKNSSIDALAKFKKEMNELQSSFINLLMQLFPKAEKEKVIEFFYFQLTFAFGLYPATKMDCIKKEAIDLAKIDYVLPEFKETYMRGIYQFMYCLENNIYF